jgi:hypothetical protein
MARMASILIPTSTTGTGTGPSDYVIALTGGTASAAITLGKNAIFVIQFAPTAAPTAPVGLNISFGNATGTLLTPSATNSYQIPSSQQTTFDLGQNNDSLELFSAVSGIAYIKVLSVL